MKSWLVALGSWLGFTLVPAYAYQEPTHEDITVESVQRSVLVTNPDLLRSLGLPSDVNSPALPGSASITGLMRGGARVEDQGGNSIHHFLDPTRASAPNNGALVLPLVGLFTWSSPTWILVRRAEENRSRRAAIHLRHPEQTSLRSFASRSPATCRC